MGYEIKDSGKRSEFQTGAVRDLQDDKGRFDLIPPEPIWALAIHYQKGSKKYGDRNWEKGIPLSRYYDSATRHLTEFWLGLDDENHLVAALWNICGLYATKIRIQLGLLPAELDDMPVKCTLPNLPRSKE